MRYQSSTLVSVKSFHAHRYAYSKTLSKSPETIIPTGIAGEPLKVTVAETPDLAQFCGVDDAAKSGNDLCARGTWRTDTWADFLLDAVF